MPLTKTQPASTYLFMRPARAAHALLRVAFAVIFGFVSLAHGPVMAFAQRNAVPSLPPAHHHVIAADAAHGEHPSLPLTINRPSVCYSFGCFVAVEASLISAPAVGFDLLENLSPALARAMAATNLNPADPPPRLQV